MGYRLYHYYDRDIGPFRNLSELSPEASAAVSARIRREGVSFASRRADDYMDVRRALEKAAREQFERKGGRPRQPYPHYMTLEPCDWLESWYRSPRKVVVGWEEIGDDAISFTYGDLFPTMRCEDGKPYRKQVYTRSEIVGLIERFGFPQHWNRNGDQGPERYIEAQIWDRAAIERWKKAHSSE